MSEQTHAFVDVLAAEQQDLNELLRALSPQQWELQTPSVGWSVRDQVIHLADTEEVARDTVTDGPKTLAREMARRAPEGDFSETGVAHGRQRPGGDVLRWWQGAAAANREALRSADVSARVPWGLGMSWRAFVTARLMEHWAHGLDIRAAVGAPCVDTDRLRSVSWICYGALPYAYHLARVSPPAGHTLRLDLTGPDGDLWSFGPSDATDTITGPAGVWCRRAVQRIGPNDAESLVASGPLAALARAHARAFL